MEYKPNKADQVDDWQTMILLYNSALKEVGTKLEILNDEFQHIHQYNPIEHIKSRVKTSESIVRKLKKRGYESTLENMQKYVNDIAGIRVICSFTSDIYRIADMLANQSDVKVLSIKDYIKYPKESGYKSYHMIVTVPVYLSNRCDQVKVEIQIRTVAMDFWASLEHSVKYKKNVLDAEDIVYELRACADVINRTDIHMQSIRDKISYIE